MRKILLTTAALTALAVATPVLAQDATAPAPDTMTTTDPAAKDLKLMKDQAQAPQGDQATQMAATDKTPTFVGQQAEDQVLASALMGATVYNSNNENLGDINDIVFSKDGGIDAVVIGVGGFLGIGEKNVAVSYDLIQTTTADDGSVKLSLNLTSDELNTAPSFVTVASLKAEQNMKDQTLAPNPAAPAPPLN